MLVDLHPLVLSKADKQKFNDLIKREHNHLSITYISAWIGFLLGIITCAINIINIMLPINAHASVYNGVWKLLFDFFGYFTTQSNILVILAYLFFLTMFKTRIFNSRNFVLAVGIYINLTMVTYWTIMLPQWIMHELDSYLWWSIFCSISFHLACPIIYDLFLLSNINYPCKKIKNPLNRIHSHFFPWMLLIYPICYILWVVLINFTKLPESAFRPDVCSITGAPLFPGILIGKDHAYASIYNQITNFNPKCFIVKYGYGDDPNIACYDDSSGGNILYALIGGPVGFVLFVNYIWIVSFNNFFTTPKEMRKELHHKYKTYESQNATIFSKYVGNFCKELKVTNLKKKSHKYGKKRNNTKN